MHDLGLRTLIATNIVMKQGTLYDGKRTSMCPTADSTYADITASVCGILRYFKETVLMACILCLGSRVVACNKFIKEQSDHAC